jgi:hypothetical protein
MAQVRDKITQDASAIQKQDYRVGAAEFEAAEGIRTKDDGLLSKG